MKKLCLLLLAFAAVSWADACTAVTAMSGGTVATPLLWSATATWTGCTTGGAHYPGQSGVDTVTIPSTAIVAVDVNVTVGASGQPYYYYPYLTGNGGSGYTPAHPAGCGGGLTTTGTSPYRAASLYCEIVNGARTFVLWDHGYYTTSTMPTLTAPSAGAGNIVFSSATNTNPARIKIINTSAGGTDYHSTGWLPGSTQNVNIAGATGDWAAINGKQTITVISDDIRYGAEVSIVGVDSSAWRAVTGPITITSPSTTFGAETGSPTWALATMAGGGTPAILINHTTTGAKGALILNQGVTLTVRGDIIVNGTYPDATTVITHKRGAHLIFDNSQYAGSLKPEYGLIRGNSTADLLLYDASDCANATKIGTDMMNHTDECWISAPGGIGDVGLDLRNVFLNSGSASAPALALGGNNNAIVGTMTIYNSWFDKSGTISNTGNYRSGNNSRAGVFDFQGNAVTRPLNSMPILVQAGLTTGGPRNISYSYFDGSFNFSVGYTTQFGGPVTSNFIGSGLYMTGYTGFGLEDNIIRTDVPSPGINSYGGIATIDHNALWQDLDKALNQRWIGCATGTPNISGWLIHLTGFHWGDPGEVGCSLNYTIAVPSATGFVGSRLESMINSAAPPLIFNHNTSAAEGVDGGVMDAGEGGQNTLHPLTFKSNLIWLPTWADHQDSPGNHSFMKLSCSTASTTDICTTTSATDSNCDYNSAYGAVAIQTYSNNTCGPTGASCVNQGRSYACSWSFTPGYHDQDASPPNFVDESRNLLWYDIARGAPLATAWSVATTYHYGDKASNTYRDASVPITYYNGKRFNYVCKVADCTGAPEPGRVDLWNTWRLYWIFGGQWQIQQDTIAHGNTLWNTDSNVWGHFVATSGYSQCTAGAPCSTTQAAMGWVAAGFRPTNPALRNAGHDGTDIGAMPGLYDTCPSDYSGGIRRMQYYCSTVTDVR